jgi:hypothetical protein
MAGWMHEKDHHEMFEHSYHGSRGDTQTASDQSESHLEAAYVADTWMHRLGVNSSQTTITVVILECMITL